VTDKMLLATAKDVASKTGWTMAKAIRLVVRMNQPKTPRKIEKSGQVSLF